MKKLLLFLLFTFVFSSCTFTEEITINSDGTGKYNLDMDGSGLMAMIPQDSLGTKNEKSVDSTFSFKQLFEEKRDSIAKLSKEEQARIKKLENFNMRMLMNYDTKKFLFSMNTTFKSVSELQNIMTDLNELNKMNKSKTNDPLAGGMGMPNFGSSNSKMNYSYDGKKFIRKAIVDKEALKKIENDSLESYKMIFDASKYIIKYHFPKPVKKISNKLALFSEDRKTITIEYTFNDYLKEPEKLNFEIDFE